MATQNNTQNNFNWFNFWTIAIAILAMLITAHGIEKNHQDFEKSLTETKKSVIISKDQYDLSKKQMEDAGIDAKKQQELQKLQFEKELNEWKKQSNASIKQIDYQINAQRPYLVTKNEGYHRSGLYNTFELVFCYTNKGIRPAINLTTHLWIIDSSFSKKLYEKGAITTTGTIVQESEECEQVDALEEIVNNVKVSYYYILIQYRDGITNKDYSQSFCFVWDRNSGLRTLKNSLNQDYILIAIAKNWQKGKVEDFLIPQNSDIKNSILLSKK